MKLSDLYVAVSPPGRVEIMNNSPSDVCIALKRDASGVWTRGYWSVEDSEINFEPEDRANVVRELVSEALKSISDLPIPERSAPGIAG